MASENVMQICSDDESERLALFHAAVLQSDVGLCLVGDGICVVPVGGGVGMALIFIGALSFREDCFECWQIRTTCPFFCLNTWP